ncbi:MAG TPA: HAD-IB family phosphatase [Sphingomonas sp.]
MVDRSAAPAIIPDPASEAAHDARPVGVTILDLDRTLTRRGTYSPFLLYVARREAPARLLLVPVVIAAMIAYKAGWIGRKRLKELMHRMMLGAAVHRSRIETLAAQFADRIVARGLHAEALPLIAAEKAAGRVLILATAAHRFYAAPLAARLGIGHVVATESEWRGDRLSPAIAGENCFGRDKADAVLIHLDRLGLSRSEIALRCYSDDRSDCPCFEESDECFVVNPSAKLQALAIARGWQRLRFH